MSTPRGSHGPSDDGPADDPVCRACNGPVDMDDETAIHGIYPHYERALPIGSEEYTCAGCGKFECSCICQPDVAA